MSHQRKISVIGLGYVGLTVAVAFGQMGKVLGFDKDAERIKELKQGIESNHEVTPQQLKKAKIEYTSKSQDLKKADFHIVTVPTPIDASKRPDFSILFAITESLARQLKEGDIVVYESTVYPGVIEEKCIPILEHFSKLTCNKNFSVGYSPERINPSDPVHTFFNTVKLISASNTQALAVLKKVYESVVKAGTYTVSSIGIAEAAKILENTQRDINIAFMNEIALILHSFGMNSPEVIAAAQTKWNFLPFKPGLVGGHCVEFNSQFLRYKAEIHDYYPEVITASLRVNSCMGKYIAEQTIKNLIRNAVQVKRARIAILGLTYKENCSDIRDSRVLDVINELQSYEVQVLIHDPLADPQKVKKFYGLNLQEWQNLNDLDAIVLAVAHKEYMALDKNELKRMLNYRGLIMDIKGILKPEEFVDTGIILWRL